MYIYIYMCSRSRGPPHPPWSWFTESARARPALWTTSIVRSFIPRSWSAPPPLVGMWSGSCVFSWHVLICKYLIFYWFLNYSVQLSAVATRDVHQHVELGYEMIAIHIDHQTCWRYSSTCRIASKTTEILTFWTNSNLYWYSNMLKILINIQT